MKKRQYSVELKKQAVEMYLEGYSGREVAKKLDIKNERRVTEWVSKAKEGGFQALDDKRGLMSKGKSKKEEWSLEEKYERLKLENEYLKKLLDLKRG
ncbi:helix-turn-helix domain-containing protein [Oceanobacillus senegalensis]|uniref:helix-turn-helix domain-containing protein n=1 Tax=Oceanobacillus senegalensis TaxID=1936063 RepID=UPI000A30FB0D|nr:helix-turn-helix domain-containing protein [Oceanobacillus senegalensis]